MSSGSNKNRFILFEGWHGGSPKTAKFFASKKAAERVLAKIPDEGDVFYYLMDTKNKTVVLYQHDDEGMMAEYREEDI
jgi:hypothetical protein